MRMRMLIFCGLAILVAGLGQVAPGADPAPLALEPGKAVDGVRITLDRAGKGVLEVAFENVDAKPVVLNLGDMVGNGRVLELRRFRLVVTDPSGKSRRLDWNGLGAYGGRLDDFLVPLMPAAKYTVTFSLGDLIGDGKDGDWSSAIAPGEKVQAVYEGAAPSLTNRQEIIPALPIWVGKVESGLLVYSD
jgi:hypothetical protein